MTVALLPSQSLLSRVNVVSDSLISYTNTLYYVMGDPLSVGNDQLILTVSPTISVVTETGVSGIYAQSRLNYDEKSL